MKDREPIDYDGKIEDARLEDIDGDLSYTIHINKAYEICQSLEKYYLEQMLENNKEIKRLLTELGKHINKI